MQVIPIQMKEAQIIALIARFRFKKFFDAERGKMVYLLRGTLSNEELSLVNDLLHYDNRRGVYITEEPEKVVTKLLQNGKLKLDMMIAVKFLSTHVQNKPNILYLLSVAYEQLVVNKEENEKFRRLLKSSMFRGDVFDFNKNRPDDWIIDEIPESIRLKNGTVINKIVWKDKDGNRYVAFSGTPPLASEDAEVVRFASYTVVWREEDIKNVSDKDIVRAINLGYFADSVVAGMGRVEHVYKEGAPDRGILALVGKVLQYDLVKDEVTTSAVAQINVFLFREGIPFETRFFDTIEQAKAWVENEVLPKYREVIKQFEEMMKEPSRGIDIYM